MKNLLRGNWKMGMSLLLGTAVFLFWYKIYPAHVAYQEQFQLFLFDSDYWWERVAVPGGAACYVSDFLTQFFYYPWMGALILALLFVSLQYLLWSVARKEGAPDVCYPLTWLPCLPLWHFMADENALCSFPVSLLLALLSARACQCFASWRGRMCFALPVIPLLYWVAGPAHFVFAAWLLLSEAVRLMRGKSGWQGAAMSVAVAAEALLCPWLSAMLVQYSLKRLFIGVEYYRYADVLLAAEWQTAALLALLPCLLPLLPRLSKRLPLWVTVQCLLVVAVGYRYLRPACDLAKEEALQYDYLTYRQQWQAIVAKAEKKAPASPFEVACLNLALAKTDQLGDRMFEFFQNGFGGLLPAHERDFTSPLPAAEAYYHIGMVNVAQRYTFEIMEAIPNFRKSARCMMRLAETNLINGSYEVAAKYLRILQKTLYYSEWADYALSYLHDEKRINAHPEWGRLRKMRTEDDCIFDGKRMDEMLGRLVDHNRDNRMASEYLLAYLLLKQDLDAVVQCYTAGRHARYVQIPRSHQEALAYKWLIQHGDFKGMPWKISPAVATRMVEFAKVYMSKQPKAKAYLQSKFADTYWCYLMNVKPQNQ